MWKVTRINNATHEVEMTHKDGTKIRYIVPDSYNSTPELREEYFQQQVTKQSLFKNVKEKSIAPIYLIIGAVIGAALLRYFNG